MVVTVRRLSAILAADVCNFSSMMGKDEDQTILTLRACNETIENAINSHNGHIFNTAGDSIVAEFSSVVDAVNCAVNFQQTLRDRNSSMSETSRMYFRVGINLGDIVVEGDNRYGDGINIAARLEALSEPGGICISGSIYGDIKSKLDLEFGALGEQVLKNIAQPVSAYKVNFGGDDETPLNMRLGSTSLATAGSPTSIYPGTVSDNLSFTFNKGAKPSIAVLPFNNMSGDPEQEYFSDGISEDIITALSHLRWLDVIARNSSFSYKGQSPDIRKVAEELDVRYVLEGSIRKSGNRVRINAQLLEGVTGTHIWAEKYDRELVDIFDLQDEITSSVLGAIEPSLLVAEIDRATRKHPDSLDAYDLYLRALPGMYSFDPQSNSKSLDLLHKAITIDPSYADAISMAAWAYEHRFTRGWEAYSENDIETGVALARRAIETKTEDPICLALSAFVLIMSQLDVQLGLLTAKRALRNNPNIGFVCTMAGASLLMGGGNNEEALKTIEHAITMSPKDPVIFTNYLTASLAHMELGDLDKALQFAELSVEANPSWDTSLQGLITILVESGNTQRAKEFSNRLLAVDEKCTVTKFDENFRISNQGLKTRMLNGLRAVGIPD